MSREIKFDSELINKFDLYSKLWNESNCKENNNNNSYLERCAF